VQRPASGSLYRRLARLRRGEGWGEGTLVRAHVPTRRCSLCLPPPPPSLSTIHNPLSTIPPPLFEALGWDLHNTKGYAEPWKEVVHEDAIKVGGSTKAPDYSFRLGGRRLFFLETKKPAINLKDDPSPAYQLRRYAWTAKLPVSILTDFEEFVVFDTRVKPLPKDAASKARILYIPYTIPRALLSITRLMPRQRRDLLVVHIQEAERLEEASVCTTPAPSPDGRGLG